MESKKNRMRIAIIADPYIAVPPDKYGGIERIITLLIEGCLSKGHEVTLFAHPASKVKCRLIPYGIPPHKGPFIRVQEVLQIWGQLTPQRNDFDIIHSFGRLVGLLPLYFSRVPKVQSYQRSISRRNVLIASALAGRSIFFTACSDNCRQYGQLPGQWATVYNAVPIERYDFIPKVADDAPLIFLGRIERIKGVHTAIDIALATGKRLIIAGNIVPQGHSYVYFKEKIEPRIDGKQITYVGEIDDVQKNKLLGQSAALLMPIEWEEPFGIVMVEALACGTPVIGFKRGAVPEVVEDGVNGFICQTKEAMAAAVGRLKEINRSKCRRIAEERFSDRVVVDQYLTLYKDLITRR